MTRIEMIEALLNARQTSLPSLEARRFRLRGMTLSGLRREMLLRGLAEYEEPDDDSEIETDYAVPAAMLATLSLGGAYTE